MSEKKLKVGIKQYRLKIGDEKKVLKIGRPTQIKILRSVEMVRMTTLKPTIFDFQYNNVTSQSVFRFLTSGYFFEVRAEIETPFNGFGAAISVGTLSDPNLLISSNEMDVSQMMAINKEDIIPFSTNEEIYLFITPGTGATQGSGRLLLEVV